MVFTLLSQYRKNLNNWTVCYVVGLSFLRKVSKIVFFAPFPEKGKNSGLHSTHAVQLFKFIRYVSIIRRKIENFLDFIAKTNQITSKSRPDSLQKPLQWLFCRITQTNCSLSLFFWVSYLPMCKGKDPLAAIARAHNFLTEFRTFLGSLWARYCIFALKPSTKPHPHPKTKNHLRG